MRHARALLAAAAVLASLVAMSPSAMAASSLPVEAWAQYKTRFVSPEGRVIDDANGNISHSEGQGYGLLLAYLADDQPAFDLIWSFTRTELLLRDDGLAVWKWDPATKPHVTDSNNASDGDILIAYAAALAGKAWGRPALTASATSMAKALGAMVAVHQGRLILMPGAVGYGAADRADGPVVNLSYWVFEAFPVLATLAPETDWAKLAADGKALLAQSLTGPRKLPPEWLALKARPRPAAGFPAEFAYNALRIPLYLVRAGETDAELLKPLAEGMSAEGGVATVDLAAGTVKERLTDAGYTIIPALVSCVVDGSKIGPDLTQFTPTLYYPSTLHLLALSFLSERHPECLS